MALSEEQRIEKSKRNKLAASKRRKRRVKKLTRKFKRNGLNFIDARYNALCVYYTYKSSKQCKKYPHRKNKYDFILAFLYFAARIFKFFTEFRFTLLKTKKRAVANIFQILVPALTCIAVFVIIKNINTYEVAVKVNINGEYFGIVKSVSDVEDIKTMIEKDISPVMNFSYSFTHNIKYVLVPVKKAEFLTQSEIYNKIYALASDTLTKAYGLYIDGKLIGAVENKEELAEVLKSVLYSEEMADNEKIEYANDIQIIEQQYSTTILTTPNIVKAVLESSAQLSKSVDNAEDIESAVVAAFAADDSLMETTEQESASVAESRLESQTIGESMIDSQMSSAVSAALTEAGKSNSISRGVAATVKDEMSKKLYAGINNNDILGSITSDSESYYSSELVLKRIRNESYSETISFTVEYINSNEYYIGTEVALNEGEDGIDYVTDSVTYIGDEEVERVRSNTITLKYPQNKIILKGIKQLPDAVPTGNFIMPVTPLYIAGGFNITGEGEDYHRGIDYVADHGAPIYASDGGTVTFAGEGTPWSYGIYVKISHSNGMETIYAHMSETTVKTGDKVYQGQVIGKVGSTGNSFGDHLHFEILKNGSLVDPKVYLKK